MLVTSIVFTLIAVTLPFISCGGDDSNDEQPKMGSFTIAIAGYPDVTVEYPGSLDAGKIADIKTKLTSAFTSINIPGLGAGLTKDTFDAVMPRGLVIVVAEGGYYWGVKLPPIDYRTISFHIDWLSADATVSNVADEIKVGVEDMAPMVATKSLSNQWLWAAIQRQKGYERS